MRVRWLKLKGPKIKEGRKSREKRDSLRQQLKQGSLKGETKVIFGKGVWLIKTGFCTWES